MGHPLFDGAFQKEALSNRQSSQQSKQSALSSQQSAKQERGRQCGQSVTVVMAREYMTEKISSRSKIR
jgi:hypothetical protein